MASTKIRRAKIIFLVFAGAISLVLLVLGIYNLVEFTDSVGFCGQLCHAVMYPEYTAYQASPHSRVSCADCHVGPGADYLVRSKISGVPQIFFTIFDTYPKPIPTPVENLRPAQDTCEQCHRPEHFAGDLVVTKTTFLTDESNTEISDSLILRVGGGEAGVAKDIHWHIAAKVWYVSTDPQRQQIDWVGVEENGQYTQEWVDPTMVNELTTEEIALKRRLMDCIDCHNRATHIFYSPEELVDNAMVQGSIDKTLPFIKKEITSFLYPPNTSLEDAYTALESIRDYYAQNYPEILNTKEDAIEQAIVQAKNIAKLTTFPHMQVNWTTYEDNSAHQQSPGCFRCHGKLVEKTVAGTGTPVNVSCDLCHIELSQPVK